MDVLIVEINSLLCSENSIDFEVKQKNEICFFYSLKIFSLKQI